MDTDMIVLCGDQEDETDRQEVLPGRLACRRPSAGVEYVNIKIIQS